MVKGLPRNQPLMQSPKQRGGLGLFPRSLPRAGDLWHGLMEWEEACERIEGAHVTFHAAVSTEIDELRAIWDEALLLDIHSMPPLIALSGEARPDVVIGDRFGVSACSRLSDIAIDVVERHGLSVALNHPYPGYYILERHGQPSRGRHALQIEISRDLYLDEQLRLPGPGLGPTRKMLNDLVFELAEELGRARWSEAAE
jgi:N-formylglutamate amidohydrolase